MRDIAAVRFGHAVRYGAMNRDGQGEVVGGVVLMLKGASSEATIKNVKARVAEIQQTLPPGLEIEPFLDRTKLVDKAIHTVVKNLVEGGVIVIVVLLLLLGNLRAGLVVAGMIPLCMLFALGLMNTFGFSNKLMIVSIFNLKLIVDGAVIIVEAVIAHLLYERAKATHETMDDITESVTNLLMRSALFGQLIILIVYLPILSLTGIEGKMFRPMALTVSFAIVGAMLLCLTHVPAVTAWALKKNISEKQAQSGQPYRGLSAPLVRPHHPGGAGGSGWCWAGPWGCWRRAASCFRGWAASLSHSSRREISR